MCDNPFFRKRCRNEDIAVEIIYNGERRKICNRCWFGKKKDGSDGLGESDYEWGEE